MIDAYASRPNYVDHIAPVWAALGDRGTLWVAEARLAQRARTRGVTAQVGAPDGARPTLVASYRDELAVPGPVVLLEHGAGQHYGGVDASSMGATRTNVLLYLAPNPDCADRMATVLPNARTVAVGCPRLDRHLGRPDPPNGPPVVGLTWHWPARTWPEAMWAWPHYRPYLPALAQGRTLVGHGHPRIMGRLIGDYRRAGVRVESDPETFLDSIDLLVADNTSLLFEAAAVGIPVAVLDAPWYRRHVEHGLRFWEWADIGPRTGAGPALPETVDRAWQERDLFRPTREAMRDAVYGPWDGKAAARAADAIADTVG